MTYCLGIITREGLVMASDSRSNAGFDQVNVCRKMYTFAVPGDRVLIVLASGSLSLTQSVITLLVRDFEQGLGLATAPSIYEACRVIGQQISHVAEIDRAALERSDFSFNIHFLLGGQIRGESPGLCLIYPQGNPLSATQDSPFLQIGECKYGRPILDRGIRYQSTTLEEAAKYALISIDSTMRSNVTVGPPIDMILYRTDELMITRRRRLTSNDPDLLDVNTRWEQALRKAMQELPMIRFDDAESSQPGTMNTDFILRPESVKKGLRD